MYFLQKTLQNAIQVVSQYNAGTFLPDRFLVPASYTASDMGKFSSQRLGVLIQELLTCPSKLSLVGSPSTSDVVVVPEWRFVVQC